MNNEQVNQLIQGMGMMVELYMIVYQTFKSRNLNDAEAIKHTKAFMTAMIESFTGNNSEEAK